MYLYYLFRSNRLGLYGSSGPSTHVLKRDSQVWTVSLPLTILNSPAISDYYDGGGDDPAFGTGRDIAGIVLWAIGLLIETTADIQKVFCLLCDQAHGYLHLVV